MEQKEYLNEKKYKKASRGLLFVGIGLMLIAVIAILVAVFPVISGKEAILNQQLEQLRPGLEERYAELESMGVRESTDYKDKDGFEMEQIGIALNPKYDYCEQISTYAKNETTQEYCDIKNQLYNIKRPTMAVGGALMIALPCFGFGLGLIMLAKRRSIMAYNIQQSMPVAKETIEKMTPTMAKSAGHVAKEVAKGVKDGLKDYAEDDDKPKDKNAE